MKLKAQQWLMDGWRGELAIGGGSGYECVAKQSKWWWELSCQNQLLLIIMGGFFECSWYYVLVNG